MSTERRTLAEVLYPWETFTAADGLPSTGVKTRDELADAARQWFLDLLADDTLLRDAHIAVAPHASQPYAAARAVLAVIAEAVRDER